MLKKHALLKKYTLLKKHTLLEKIYTVKDIKMRRRKSAAWP